MSIGPPRIFRDAGSGGVEGSTQLRATQYLLAPASNAVFSAGAQRIPLPNSAERAAGLSQPAQALVRHALEDWAMPLR
jgi:hypothetical protein